MEREDGLDLIKIRILIYIYKVPNLECTVTSIGNALSLPKYTISRGITNLEEHELIKRIDKRFFTLTRAGKDLAVKYSQRMNVCLNYLLSKGVKGEIAKCDAMYISTNCSQETIDVIKNMSIYDAAKEKLIDQSEFYGSTLCRKLEDGIYNLNYVMYKSKPSKGENLSMANQGFEHPCMLTVKDKVGIISLKTKYIHRLSICGTKIGGKVESLQYDDGEKFCYAECIGDIISFPAEFVKFKVICKEPGLILHGSIYLKMSVSVAKIHMPESTAIFTILL